MTHDRTHLDEAELALLGITGNGPTARFMRALIAHLRASHPPPIHNWVYEGLGRNVCRRWGSTFLGNTDERPAGPCYGPAEPAKEPSEADRPGCGTCGSPCVKCGTMKGVSLHIFDGECYCDACSTPTDHPSDHLFPARPASPPEPSDVTAELRAVPGFDGDVLAFTAGS